MNKENNKLKRLAVFAAMGVLCAGSIWVIFSPSDADRAALEAQAGFNTEIPDPKNEGIIGDKRDAYEKEQTRQNQADRMRTLSDFSALLGRKDETEQERVAREERQIAMAPKPPEYWENPERFEGGGSGGGYTSRPNPSIEASAMAYNDINRTLGNFYDVPAEDPEKEELRRRLEELQAQVDESASAPSSVGDQLALMERSFQMAAKYMPNATAAPGTGDADIADVSSAPQAAQSGKTVVSTVRREQKSVVSLLSAPMSDAEFVTAYSAPRNMGFITAAGNETAAEEKNTIAACVLTNQTVRDGQSVRLRLLEPMRVGGTLVPRNTILAAAAKIAGERLELTVGSVESGGTILPVKLIAHDTDGQSGIFIPDLQAISAAKEIVAGMGQSAGQSINLSGDAAGQLAADMGRNLMQGVSQFTAKKLREVKVHLKAGHRVLLLPNNE
ncbi:MAG: conjugative transposon protein TraM [Alistipes sp.]|jgi:conjugative transposon TraM protein|nr:conjugative transposon protein TraM [Alistipes sp.]